MRQDFCSCPQSYPRRKGLRPVFFRPCTLWRTWGTRPGNNASFFAPNDSATTYGRSHQVASSPMLAGLQVDVELELAIRSHVPSQPQQGISVNSGNAQAIPTEPAGFPDLA